MFQDGKFHPYEDHAAVAKAFTEVGRQLEEERGRPLSTPLFGVVLGVANTVMHPWRTAAATVCGGVVGYVFGFPIIAALTAGGIYTLGKFAYGCYAGNKLANTV